MVAAVALLWKGVDFVKYLSARDKNAVVTQLATWASGFGVTNLLAHSDFADTLELGGKMLGSMGWPSLMLIGLSMGSTASGAFDIKKALDNSDSAKTPDLLQSSWPPPDPKQ